ncbi:hypothetical protein [Thiorhodovibrio winogradskyi]|uniref:hypothetical protein n=1 Tax=Thiorhodovibrio winogradskyi TaxID=77007 RepID=UPI002E2C2E9E|nr:hypothetical protein [Thiorhodovibrio winogradskyi]
MVTNTRDTSNPDTSNKAPLRQWHRAFGIALVNVFADAPWVVELEQELALKSQLLDVAIIEAADQRSPEQPATELPDGLGNLRTHNLLTYKSHHEALTAWVLFASEQDRMRLGLAHYRARHTNPSQHGHWELLEHLYRLYRREVPEMA